MSESLCFKHNKHHVYSESECPWCEIERLKAELEQTRVQLAGCGVAAMCNTRESMAKQMCKPTDYGYSASYQDVLNAVNREIHLRETLEETQCQLAEARAEVEEVNVYKKYVQIEGGGPTYCLHGSSSIAAFTALEVKLAEVRAELASYKAGVEVEGYVTGVPTDINKDLYFASGWSRELNAFSNKRVRVLVCPQAGGAYNEKVR